MAHAVRLYKYTHCDVFAQRPYSGNSLAVFPESDGLSAAQMLTITQELRHFESIFLQREGGVIKARIFQLHEELPFAGHPIIGAACSLHRAEGGSGERQWKLHLQGGRVVSVQTRASDGGYFGTLDQGRPEMICIRPEAEKAMLAEAFNLPRDAIAALPLEVISTGLKYLVVPVTGGLAEARVTRPDLGARLAKMGADFAYLFDVTRFEGRHWDNDGLAEDIATGSAAGVVGTYAVKHGLVEAGQTFVLKQGHFLNRASALHVTAYGQAAEISRVTVAGAVAFVGSGEVVAP